MGRRHRRVREEVGLGDKIGLRRRTGGVWRRARGGLLRAVVVFVYFTVRTVKSPLKQDEQKKN